MIATDQIHRVIDGHSATAEYAFECCSEFVAQNRMHADQSLVLVRKSLTLPRRFFRFIQVREIGELLHFHKLQLGLQFLAALVCCWLAGEFSDTGIFPRPLDPAQAVIMILVSFPKGIGRW